MRVRFEPRTNATDHSKMYGKGGLQVFHGAYGAGIGQAVGSMLLPYVGKYALNHLLIPAGKSALKGAALGAFSELGGTYADKVKAAKRGALKGAVFGAIGGSKKRKKQKGSAVKRPF